MGQYSIASIQKICDALKSAELPKYNAQDALKKFKPAINIALKKGLNHNQIITIINKNLAAGEQKFNESQLNEFLSKPNKKEKLK